MYKWFWGSIYLRPIAEHDALRVTVWRNKPEARAAFFSGAKVVTPDTHIRFFWRRDDHDLVWIAEGDLGEAYGMVSLTVDVDRHSAQFGRLMVAPEYAGHGMAEKITRAAMAFGFEVLCLSSLWLHVKASNEKAIDLYERVGWKQTPMCGHPFDGQDVNCMQYTVKDWYDV